MAQGYFDNAPFPLAGTSAVASIGDKNPSSGGIRSPQPALTACPNRNKDERSERPRVHTLQSTQDILQHKNTIERIANAFAV